MADVIEQLRKLAEWPDDCGPAFVNDVAERAATELEALRKRCEAVEAALPALRAEVRALKENPNQGDMVFRCGFNGAIDCVVGRIDQAIAAAQEPSHG